MSSFIEVDKETLATIVDNYLKKAKSRYISGLDEAVKRRVEELESYKNSFWAKVLLKKPSPLKDLEAEARQSWTYQYRAYYARRLAFVEKFRLIVENSDSVKRIFISASDYQHLNDCDLIYDYKLTGNWGEFMKKEDWM